MKKQIISLAVFLAARSFAFAQTGYLSEIKIEDRQVSKTEDRNVNVKMNLNLDGLHIDRQHSVRIVPVLASADGSHEQELPVLVINGTVRDKVIKREEALGNSLPEAEAVGVVCRKNGTEQTVEYDASVRFKRWMIGSGLNVKAYVTGCAACGEGNEVAYTGDVLPEMVPDYYMPQIKPEEEIVKRRSETRSARLQFRQNSHTIDPKFKKNASELDEVRNSLRLVKDNNDLAITGIYVTGYSSPEGTAAYNMLLSERRAKALIRYMKNDMDGIDPSVYHVDWKGEDWSGLRAEVLKHPRLLKQDEVLKIIDSCGADKDVCEEQLKALMPPTIYQRLLNEMYGPVRRNEYRIEYTVRHFDLEEGRQMVKIRPDLMSVSEIQQVADSYGMGTEARTDCLLTAAKTYPDNVAAVNNAALALIESGRTAEAITLLEDAPEDGALLNMLGVACAKAGQTEKARAAFAKAAEKGYAKASDNLELLRGYEAYMAE